MRTKELVYLACPYTSSDKAVERQRYEEVTIASAWLVKAGIANFSPITQSYAQHELLSLPGTFSFWSDVDLFILSKCDKLVVMMYDGWKESVGVQAEMSFAELLGIPTVYRTNDQLLTECKEMITKKGIVNEVDSPPVAS